MAWYNIMFLVIVASIVISLALAFVFGYWCCEQQQSRKSLMARLGDRDEDRSAHQRRTLEKNTLGRFKNAIERAYPGRFSMDIQKNCATDGYYLPICSIYLPREDIGVARVTVNASSLEGRITLSYAGSGVAYPLAGIDGAIETIVTYLRQPHF